VPINYTQLQNQIKQAGKEAVQREHDLQARLAAALSQLPAAASDPDALRSRVTAAASANPNLRSALPGEEALNAVFPSSALQEGWVILAGDGSQINPSHHEAVPYGLINLGVLRYLPGSGETPQEITQTSLLFGDKIQTRSGQVSEEWIALQRDVQERHLLLELAHKEERPAVVLTDGGLEIFGEPKPDKEFQEAFADYLDSIAELCQRKAAVAGYVDKPMADLLVRLLEISLLAEDRLDQAGKDRPLEGLTDALLLENLLPPGCRSAVMGVQSRSSLTFNAKGVDLAFFYLNVGREGYPVIARVELPKPVAHTRDLVDQLQAVLLDQCRVMGKRPYPYVLHRAHEIAVVKLDEHQKVDDLLAAEMRRQGIEPGWKSNKQAAKDLPGKVR
jgi:hypothetical protein